MNSIDYSSLSPRRVKPSELGALIALWHDVFGDDEEFITEFYREIKPRAVAVFDSGRAAAMINICDISLGSARGGYIYAAAVASQYRGKGLFTPLMRFCERVCADDGLDFLFLIPAGEHLWPLYRHFGYSLCRTPVYECPNSEIFDNALPAENFHPPVHHGFIARSKALEKMSLEGLYYVPHDGGLIFSHENNVSENECGENIKKIIKIYELFCSETISDGIIEVKKVSDRFGMIKNLHGENDIRGFGLLLDV
ncbi:MAG: GNAT family N-acetyltransferase [Eubacteriales bacterium]